MRIDSLTRPIASLMPLLSIACALLVLAPAAHAQTDSTLATFLKENVIENEIRFQENDEAASYLRTLDPGRLRVVRNALRAQHGYVFDDSTLQRYFEKQDWYEAQEKGGSLSSVDQANMTFVETLEDRVRTQLEAFYEKFPPCDVPVRISSSSHYYSRGRSLDSLSVEVLLDHFYNRRRPSYTRAGCTIAKTDRYRVVIYERGRGSGFEETTYYKTATFDANGWRRSKRTLLEFYESEMGETYGQVTILGEEDIVLEAEQVEVGMGGRPGELDTSSVQRSFTINPDGMLVPLNDQ